MVVWVEDVDYEPLKHNQWEKGSKGGFGREEEVRAFGKMRRQKKVGEERQ